MRIMLVFISFRTELKDIRTAIYIKPLSSARGSVDARVISKLDVESDDLNGMLARRWKGRIGLGLVDGSMVLCMQGLPI